MRVPQHCAKARRRGHWTLCLVIHFSLRESVGKRKVGGQVWLCNRSAERNVLGKLKYRW